MLIRLIISPADEHRSGANQMRQHLSFREHFTRGNALLIQIAALHKMQKEKVCLDSRFAQDLRSWNLNRLPIAGLRLLNNLHPHRLDSGVERYRSKVTVSREAISVQSYTFL